MHHDGHAAICRQARRCAPAPSSSSGAPESRGLRCRGEQGGVQKATLASGPGKPNLSGCIPMWWVLQGWLHDAVCSWLLGMSWLLQPLPSQVQVRWSRLHPVPVACHAATAMLILIRQRRAALAHPSGSGCRAAAPAALHGTSSKGGGNQCMARISNRITAGATLPCLPKHHPCLTLTLGLRGPANNVGVGGDGCLHCAFPKGNVGAAHGKCVCMEVLRNAEPYSPLQQGPRSACPTSRSTVPWLLQCGCPVSCCGRCGRAVRRRR